MWVLVSSKGTSYTLVTGKEHVIGRKDGDLVLADDQSISRRHAAISVEHDIKSLGDPSKLPVVTITEAASKYGTFLNDGIEKAVKMTNGSSQILKDGDRIRFGLQWNNWRLEHRPLIVTTSTLTPAEKKDLKQHIMLLGGHLVSTWRDDVTHVVMSSLTLTVKVVCALALGRPIVMPEYWSEYIKSLSLKQSLPDCKDHIPPLAESTLNMNEVSFGVNQERKNLFSGKIFVFSSEHQYNSYSCMVNAAGGKAVMLDSFGRRKENLLKPDVIVMQYSLPRNSQDSQIPQAYVDVSRFLRSNGRRTIPESEIGLAILHCSLERNCNPEFSVASTLISNESREIDTQRQVVLALDTQATDSEANKKSGKLIIPESGTVAKPSASNTPLNQKTKTVIPESGSAPKSPVSRTAVNIKLVIPESGSTPKSSNSHIQEQKKLIIPESGTVPDVSDTELSTVPIEKDHDVIVVDQSSQFSIGKIKRERISVSDETDAALHPPKRSRKSIEDGFLQKKSSGTKDARACSPLKMEVKEESDNEDLFRFPNDSGVKSSKQESDGEDDRDMFAFTEEPHITQPDFLVNKRRSPLSPCSPPSAESPRKRKNVDMEVEQVRKRPALEKRVPSPIEHSKQISLNGFISVNSEKKENISTDDTMTDLAEGVKNVTVVEVKPLVSRKCNIETSSFNSSTVNNFKKFRKVQAVTYRPIIKPQDMVPFYVDTKGLNEWLNESHNSEAVHNVVGENDDENDDWAFLQPSDTSALNKTKRR